MQARPFLRLTAAAALGASLLCSGPAPVSAALDFTLRHGRISADGAALDSPYITDRDQKIFLQIPNTWKATDAPNALEFVPDITGARVRIESVSGVQALPMDEAGKVALRQRVDKSLPGGAKNVTPLPEVDAPLPINGWQDVEIGRTYEFYGQTVCYSVMFINMEPGRVVQVTVSAPRDSFEKVHDGMRLLMFSWSEPSPETLRRMESGELRGS